MKACVVVLGICETVPLLKADFDQETLKRWREEWRHT